MPENEEALFKIESILSITIERIILSAVAILFVLLCTGLKDPWVLAQTGEAETDKIHNEKNNPSQVKNSDKSHYAETSGQSEPGIIKETVEPVTESWGSMEGFGEKIDWFHYKVYDIAQTQIERIDSWFKPPQDEQSIASEPSRFRVGLYGEGKYQEYKDLDIKPVGDLDAEIELPNLKRRLKLIITTNDPTTIPGKTYIEQPDKSFRTVLMREWRRYVSTAIGVRLRWKPELFAYAVWARDWKAGNWLLYPRQKLYWENGIGEISTLVLDHWIKRWNTRFSTSIKWSKQSRDDDQMIGREDNGFRWSEVFLLEYAKELLDESQLGRVVSGDDIARGWGIRLSAFGGFHFTDEYRTGIFYRYPLRKKWIYSFAGPEIKWRNDNNWDREWVVKCGIEMFFWGGKER